MEDISPPNWKKKGKNERNREKNEKKQRQKGRNNFYSHVTLKFLFFTQRVSRRRASHHKKKYPYCTMNLEGWGLAVYGEGAKN